MNVPVRIAAKVYKKDPAWIRMGLREGWLPIGVATKNKRRYSYYISPKLLYERTGFKYDSQ